MATTASPLLLTAQDAGVRTLTLNRPEVLNGLTDDLLDELAHALGEAAADPEVRAVIITGAGRGFCSGQDLKSAGAEGTIDVEKHLREHYLPAIRAVREIEKPVIAAVNGVAAGAGLSLALAADFRIAAGSASFVQAFVRIGLVPDAGSTWFLPRIVGLAKATEMMMLGESLDSDEALRIGLIHRIVPNGDLLQVAGDFAARLARGPRSVGMIKRLLNHSFENGLEDQFALEERAQAEAVTTADFMEGVTAFLQKRPATFTGS